MFVTDFDGTLLGSDKILPNKTLNILKNIGDAGVIKVIATGR